MSEEKKEAQPDVVLHDGREIRFNLYEMTLEDWRKFVDPDEPKEFEDRLLERVSGLEEGSLTKMAFLDWRKLSSAFVAAASKPLDNPNA